MQEQRFVRARAIGFVLLAMLAAAAPAQQPGRDLRVEPAGRRLALVIGNEAYPKWPLKNPVNDARAMDKALRDTGFRTDLVINGKLRDVEQAVDRFVATLHPGDVALFYYAGHGVQLSGDNFIVPVDFDAKDEADAKYASYAISRVQERMEGSGSQLNVLILDACRNNPFRTSRAAGGGLGAMNAGRGTLIAFATGPGKTADDSAATGNGLFTGHVVKALREPGLTLDQIFNRVRERVDADSRHQQTPWSVTSVIGEFRFMPGPQGAGQPAATAPASPPASESTTREVQSPAPDGPSPSDMAKLREDLFKLGVRGDTIRNSLQSLQKQIAATGGNLRVDMQRAASLMNGYLESASGALNAQDATAARDYMQKAEKQIEILEKYLHL
jgi:uncharacterized caspase-like protein